MIRAQPQWVVPSVQSAGDSLSIHEKRPRGRAARNTAKGETFVREVPPEMFDFFEDLHEAPEPAELEGAIAPNA